MFSLFKRFKEGLARTAGGALGKIAGLFSKKIDPADIELIEETLLEADFGYDTVRDIVSAIESEFKRDRELRGRRAAEIGAEVLARILEGSEGELAGARARRRPPRSSRKFSGPTAGWYSGHATLSEPPRTSKSANGRGVSK